VLPDLRRITPLAAWSRASWTQRGQLLRGILASAIGQRVLASAVERKNAEVLAKALALLAKETGEHIFVDSSKNVAHFLRLSLSPSHRIVPVHLIRDPRAVAWSGRRRTGIDPIVMARHWKKLNLSIAWLKGLTSRYPWQLVRYEDFCAGPVSMVTKLLSTANPREHDSQTFASAIHALGGSPDLPGANDSIVPDERWKLEMPKSLQQRIMQTVGRTAYRFGYH
jgi:hypothetical protein